MDCLDEDYGKTDGFRPGEPIIIKKKNSNVDAYKR
jgi:hypothetical protein